MEEHELSTSSERRERVETIPRARVMKRRNSEGLPLFLRPIPRKPQEANSAGTSERHTFQEGTMPFEDDIWPTESTFALTSVSRNPQPWRPDALATERALREALEEDRMAHALERLRERKRRSTICQTSNLGARTSDESNAGWQTRAWTPRSDAARESSHHPYSLGTATGSRTPQRRHRYLGSSPAVTPRTSRELLSAGSPKGANEFWKEDETLFVHKCTGHIKAAAASSSGGIAKAQPKLGHMRQPARKPEDIDRATKEQTQRQTQPANRNVKPLQQKLSQKEQRINRIKELKLKASSRWPTWGMGRFGLRRGEDGFKDSTPM